MAKVPGVAPWGMTIDALLARAEAGGWHPCGVTYPLPHDIRWEPEGGT